MGDIVDSKKIIVLLLIIIVLLIVLGMMLINPLDAKTDTKITVNSNATLYEGDYFSISLTDVNGAPLNSQTVNIIITDANGVENHQQVSTDGMGNAMLQLNGLAVGEYDINVTYEGNENYSSSSASQNLTIDEIHQEVVEYDYPYHSSLIGDYRITDLVQDEIGVIQASSGEYYVITGDGLYTYEGLDSQGYITWGSEIG